MNDNETIKVTAELDASASQQQIKTALSNIQKGLSPIKTAVSVDTSAAKKQLQDVQKQLQDVQKQFAALSASAKSASDAQQSFWKSTQGTGKEIITGLNAVKTMYSIFKPLDGISTEYALFPQAA